MSRYSTICEHCKQKLASQLSLTSHQRNNKRCVEIQRSQLQTQTETQDKPEPFFATSSSYEDQKYKLKSFNESELNESNIIRSLLESEARPANSRVTDEEKKLYLGLLQAMAMHHNSIAGGDNFLMNEINEYKNSCFSDTAVQQTKNELKQWLDAEKFHMNCVWNGVVQGDFNPARGRGGSLDEQKRISAIYLWAALKKKNVMNQKHQEMMKRKIQLYAPWERLSGSFNLQEGDLLNVLYGTSRFPVGSTYGGTSRGYISSIGGGGAERRLQTVADWALVFSWFEWKHILMKKVVMMRLKHPIPISVAQNAENDIRRIHEYLAASPQTGCTS